MYNCLNVNNQKPKILSKYDKIQSYVTIQIFTRI